MDECQKARVRGYLKFGDFGAVSGPFGDGISDFCACGPPARIPQLFNVASNYMASLGFNMQAFDPTIPRIDFQPVNIVTEVPCNQPFPFAAAAQGRGFQVAASPPPGTPVCAKVGLQLSQDMTLTRSAFRGTLLLENNGAGSLTDILLEVEFRDAGGGSASSLFAVTGPTLAGGLTGVGGSGTLVAGGEGSAEYLFIPTQDAAPLSPTVYFVGGTLRYTEDGQVVTIRLLPGVITVLPEARLTLDYFQQRDVYSDDPFTPEIEAAEPFALALRVRNAGAGVARNFRITSAQPRIIEDEKGLVVDFQLLSTRLGNQPLNPSFNLNLGNVEPGESKTVIWDMTSTVQGKFIDYRASFEHVDALGSKNLSLIEGVSIHELIHVVRADRAGDDTLPDFLVNDSPDPENFPDIVYLSEGSTSAVSRATSPIIDSPPTTNDLQVQLTVTMPPGFSSLRMTNPGPEFRLVSVRRSDGRQLLMGQNACTTDRTFPSSIPGAIHEKLLHIFDHDSTGSYTLNFAPITEDTTPPVSAIAALPGSSAAGFALEWDGADDTNGSGVAFFDIFVSVNGGPFTNWLAHTALRSAIFSGVMGNTYAFYSLATDAAGNQEITPANPDAQTSTTGGANTPPTLVPVADVTINEGGLFSLVPSVLDSDVPQQTLSYALTAAPSGANLDPTTGLITWLTGEAQGGTTNRFTLVVSDNGLPSLSSTQSFNVIVREVNSAPFFVNPAADVEVDEETALAYTVAASDADLPANQLTWELAPGAPVGMSIHPGTGLLSWLPGESRGPDEYLVSITVRDNGSPVQSAIRTLRVIVREVNRSPVLAPIATHTALVGSTLFVTNSATDPDIPAQEFFYSIVPGAPRGARIDRVTGVMSWTPTPAYARTTNSITVRVTDNGVPSLTDSETFQVIVGDYLEVRLGRAVVLAGQTSSVPVVIATTTPVTNATCIVELPDARLDSFSLSPPAAPLASATLQPLAGNRFLLRFGTLPGQQLAAEQTISQLRFTAALGQSSAFVPLAVSAGDATQVNGLPVPRADGVDGRVAYLGAEPLLEIVNTNQVQLVLYSRPAPAFSVQTTLSLNSPIHWLPFWTGSSSNLIDVRVLETTNATQFFRATLP